MRANKRLTSINIKNRGSKLSIDARDPAESNYG